MVYFKNPSEVVAFFGDFKVSECLKNDVIWSRYLAVIQRFDSVLAYNPPVMFEIIIDRPDATWSAMDYSRRAYHVAGC